MVLTQRLALELLKTASTKIFFKPCVRGNVQFTHVYTCAHLLYSGLRCSPSPSSDKSVPIKSPARAELRNILHNSQLITLPIACVCVGVTRAVQVHLRGDILVHAHTHAWRCKEGRRGVQHGAAQHVHAQASTRAQASMRACKHVCKHMQQVHKRALRALRTDVCCVRACTCVRAWVRAWERGSVGAWVRGCVRTCARAGRPASVHACVRACARAAVRPCVHPSICARAPIRPCVCTDVHACGQAITLCV